MTGIDLNTVEEDEEEAAEEVAANGSSPAPARAGAVCLELWHACCRVVDVTLLADAATDEVYAQLSLVPEKEEVARRADDGEGEDGDGMKQRFARMPHMFCKTLTASDTSTHGGFSVPRRAAEDCFPPLDYSQQRPSQELVAKDLHGTEWRFRHIYRGQPRRHLLTTGWSAFVNKKKLVSGDAVLFLRGDDGELRLGVRRAAQLKNGSAFPALYNQCSNLGTLANVAHAVATESVFNIYYNPRLSQSEFIVPYWKFMKSLSQPFSVGLRFKMRYESEDATERRYTGIITGSGDTDPMWHGSKWKCLLVRWDDDAEFRRPNRVSPWEIELTSSVSGSHLSTPHSKRLKPCLPHVNPEYMVPRGGVCPDFAESAQFHKVLQGQELFRPYRGTLVDASMGSNGFHQQDSPRAPGVVNKWQAQLHGRAAFHGPPAPALPSQSSSPPSVLMFQQANSKMPRLEFGHGQLDKHENDRRVRFGPSEGIERREQRIPLQPYPTSGEVIDGQVTVEKSHSPGRHGKDGPDNKAVGTNSCKIFGISLTEKVPAREELDDGDANYSLQSLKQVPKSLGNSCATVHEQRPVVGRMVAEYQGDGGTDDSDIFILDVGVGALIM
uniref:Auxin response factor n=1 Tax=Oryza barthii TaxID=65489 RepID=A0A0D3GAT4_9ORYZ